MNAPKAGSKLDAGAALAELEALVYGRESAKAYPRLLALLRGLATGEVRLESQAMLARVGAAAGACLLDPKVEIGAGQIAQLAVLGRTLDNLFAAGPFGTSDHLLEALGARDTASLQRLRREDPQRFLKSLALLSIDSKLPVDATPILEAEPQVALLTYLSLLSAKPITSPAGHARRERLLELAPALKPGALPRSLDHLVLTSSAWMLCSYAERLDKHRIKPVLNRMLRGWMQEGGMTDAELPPVRRLVERPTLLVAAEIMHSNHVQYRYFGQYLRQLRGRFRLVLLTEEQEADAHVRGLFDEVHLYRRTADTHTLGQAVNTVKRVAPDVIFWLSVGMRHWGPPMANLRLAPIQIAALGHSASTFCDSVDYYLTEEGYVSDPSLLSEQVVLLPDASLVFERSPHYRPHPPAIRERPSPLRIALPSNLLKLNPAFIAVLRRIRDAAGRPLEFVVFPNVAALELAATRRALARELPGAIVLERMAYNAYLERLSQCDLNLSPFPFGGLHSVVDSLRQGVPVVAMEGADLHARTDAMLLRRLGMPDWLVSRDVQGYVSAALRIIRDDALRVQLSGQALALDIDRTLFGDATTPLRSEVVDAMWWIYRNHEAIKASGRRSFTAADRAAWPA